MEKKDNWFERVGLFLFTLVLGVGVFMAGWKIGREVAEEEHKCPSSINIMKHEGVLMEVAVKNK